MTDIPFGSLRTAVLFLVFNRPDTTAQVFAAIRQARPPRLYVNADGPRESRAGEEERCAEVRRIATAVDWPCQVKTLFREKNLGCKLGVSAGIDWFFENEEEGIILEDDVLPQPSFFPYCEELLDRYRSDKRIGLISGCNLISNRFSTPDSYFFSRYSHIWGWASWRRAWRHYDVSMLGWPTWRDSDGLRDISDGSKLFRSYWRAIFQNAYAGRVDTWDYPWTFACWRKGMVTVLPAVNQTYNLGFGPDATHTTAGIPGCVRESQPQPLALPLKHPEKVNRNAVADRLIDRYFFGITLMNVVKQHVASIPVLGRSLKLIKRGIF